MIGNEKVIRTLQEYNNSITPLTRAQLFTVLTLLCDRWQELDYISKSVHFDLIALLNRSEKSLTYTVQEDNGNVNIDRWNHIGE